MRQTYIAGFRSGTTTYAVAELRSPVPGRCTVVMLPLAHGKAITTVTLPWHPAPRPAPPLGGRDPGPSVEHRRMKPCRPGVSRPACTAG